MNEQTSVQNDATRWTYLANGRKVPTVAVEALDRFDAEVWPGATFHTARAAIVAVVLEATRDLPTQDPV